VPRGSNDVPVSAFFLVLLGILLVLFGFLAGGNLPLVALGVVSLIAGGVFETLAIRRR
jgi:hypothetical protein